MVCVYLALGPHGGPPVQWGLFTLRGLEAACPQLPARLSIRQRRPHPSRLQKLKRVRYRDGGQETSRCCHTPNRVAYVSSPSWGSQWRGLWGSQEAQAWQNAVSRLEARASGGWTYETKHRSSPSWRDPGTPAVVMGKHVAPRALAARMGFLS